jgi:hypothetical protein
LAPALAQWQCPGFADVDRWYQTVYVQENPRAFLKTTPKPDALCRPQ